MAALGAWGAVVVNGAVAFKTGWTFVLDYGGAGALARLPAAIVGLPSLTSR